MNQIAIKTKCSKCGSLKPPKNVTRERKYILRCVECNHEKIITSVTVTAADKVEYALDYQLSMDVYEF
jgi:uncharacterized Zn finger protein